MRKSSLFPLVIILIGLFVLTASNAFTSELRIPFEKNVTATPGGNVKVRIQSGDSDEGSAGTEGPTIKLKVETGETSDKLQDAADIINEKASPISPVDTKAIDEAGKEIGKKIDQSSGAVAKYLGDWVNNRVINGITWLKVILSLMALSGVILVERGLSRLILWRLAMLRRKGKEYTWGAMFLEALRKPMTMFIWVYGVYFAFSPILHEIHPPFQGSPIHDLARKITNVAGVIAVVWLTYRILKLIDAYLDSQARSPRSIVDPLLASFIGKTVRVVLMIIGGFLVMQNLTGINAAAIVASLGIGGLALALAAKEPLTNIFGTFTILADKPFSEGQWVKIEKYDGFVESVGYRSTRLRTWDGYLVSIPNQKIMTCELENMATREFTRWTTTIRLPIDVTTETMDRAVKILEDILDDHECLNPRHPPRIYISDFDEWSMNIWVSCWYYSSDWWGYMAWVHRTLREIKFRFQVEGIRLAVPIQSLRIQSGESVSRSNFEDRAAIPFSANG